LKWLWVGIWNFIVWFKYPAQVVWDFDSMIESKNEIAATFDVQVHINEYGWIIYKPN